MGNTAELKQWDIKFVQNMEDPNFGNIDIYRNETGKHVMMLRRTFVKNGDDRPLNDFLEMLEFAKDDEGLLSKRSFEQGELITPILHTEKTIQNNLCIVYEIYETYCEYFNFTLKDMVRHKKQMDMEEIWLCFHWMLKLSIFLKEKNWKLHSGITLDHIFITLKGLPTVSIHHLGKIREEEDFILEKAFEQRNEINLKEIARCVLQLFCLTQIGPMENCELYLRKCEKADPKLGELLGKILRKSLKKSQKVDEQTLLEEIQFLLEHKEISESREIRLNKFKYIIPKPNIKEKTITETTENKIKDKQETNESVAKQENSFQKKDAFVRNNSENKKSDPSVVINQLQGRKNKSNSQYGSMRQSHKRNILNLLEHNNLPNNTPLPKTSLILANEIQSRKRASEKQWQKITERKEMLLRTNMKQNVNLSDKENILQNSIAKIKPSKQTWSRKVMSEQMKNSKRKVAGK